MRILVTGSAGLLGGELCRVLSARHEVVATTRLDTDICHKTAIQARLRSERPDLVIHAAAYTRVDAAETNPDMAYAVNVVGTENVALACQKMGVVMMYISSGGVFNGQKEGPYTEFDLPDPLTVYHKSKLEGEKVVASLLNRYYIVRMGWLFGGDFSQPKNFVARRIEEARGCSQLLANTGQCGSPTWIRDAAMQIGELTDAEHYGTYHVANAGSCSRFEYVKEILRMVGSPTEVLPAPPESFRRAAPVARNEAIRNYHLQLLGLDNMRPWREALHSHVGELKKELVPGKGSAAQVGEARN